MVVPGDHVLRAEVYVRADVRTRRAEQERLVFAGDAVSVCTPAPDQDGDACQCPDDVPHARARHTLLLHRCVAADRDAISSGECHTGASHGTSGMKRSLRMKNTYKATS